MRDLILLVADKAAEHAVRGALGRNDALAIRAVDFDVRVDTRRDSGVRSRGVQTLALERRRFRHAVLMFDYEGSGAATAAADLEAQLDRDLFAIWSGSAKAIVIEPEVDVWMWGAENHIRDVAGWTHPPESAAPSTASLRAVRAGCRTGRAWVAR